MIINLSEVQFYNDFYSIELPNGGTLFLNKVNEELKTDTGEVAINSINIVYVDTELNQYECTNIIGLSDNFIKIDSKYKEYLGLCLNKDNMIYSTIEVADE